MSLYRRYVALGDSFTEGLCDPPLPGAAAEWRGWADRVAEALAARARGRSSPFDYANLAIRGRLLGQIVTEQLPVALELRPDLVSIAGGGNDVLRPGVDVDAVTGRLEEAVAALRTTGATVVVSTSYDPRHAPLIRRTRGLAAIFAANVWSIANRHGALVLDLWGMRALRDRRMWAADRIHLTALGHERVAAQALELLRADVPHAGAPGVDWRAVLEPGPAPTRQQIRREDVRWLREYAVPWVGRRLRGRSSGDGLAPKRPLPTPFDAASGTPPDAPVETPSADDATRPPVEVQTTVTRRLPSSSPANAASNNDE